MSSFALISAYPVLSLSDMTSLDFLSVKVVFNVYETKQTHCLVAVCPNTKQNKHENTRTHRHTEIAAIFIDSHPVPHYFIFPVELALN